MRYRDPGLLSIVSSSIKETIHERNWLTRIYDAATNKDMCQNSYLMRSSDTVYTADAIQLPGYNIYVIVIDIIRLAGLTSL